MISFKQHLRNNKITQGDSGCQGVSEAAPNELDLDRDGQMIYLHMDDTA